MSEICTSRDAHLKRLHLKIAEMVFSATMLCVLVVVYFLVGRICQEYPGLAKSSQD